MAAVSAGNEERGLYGALLETRLLVNIPWSNVNIGDDCLGEHPCFKPKDTIHALAELGKFETVIGTPLDTAAAVLTDFWENFTKQFEHPVTADIQSGKLNAAFLVPINVHGDGGRTFKKSEIMILQFQSAIGGGSRLSGQKRKLPSGAEEAGFNLSGHSLATRYLMSCLTKKHYSDDPAPLLGLLGCVSDWLGDLYENGYEYRGEVWRFVPVGLKGDLVFHAKAAGLERSFTRVRKRKETAKSKPLQGCCPWCLAGTKEVSFECFDKEAPWMQTTEARNPIPWTETPTILRSIQVSADQPSFLKPDLFHILQMGVYKEFAASGLCLLLPFCGGSSQDENMATMNQYLVEYVKETKSPLHMPKLSLELIGAKTPNAYASGGWNKGQDSVVLMGFVGWLIGGLVLKFGYISGFVDTIFILPKPHEPCFPPNRNSMEQAFTGKAIYSKPSLYIFESSFPKSIQLNFLLYKP